MFCTCQRYGAEVAQSLFGDDGGRGERQNGGAESGREHGGGHGGGGDGRSTAGSRGGAETGREAGGSGLIPALVNFVRLELEDWERRRYSQVCVVGWCECWGGVLPFLFSFFVVAFSSAFVSWLMPVWLVLCVCIYRFF